MVVKSGAAPASRGYQPRALLLSTITVVEAVGLARSTSSGPRALPRGTYEDRKGRSVYSGVQLLL